MKRIDLETARCLLDFSGGKKELEPLAGQQLEGAVALHNRLADQRVAYLADEVGMGKTYIALGVVALMRRFNPSLRVLYLLPKSNVRDKWKKDYRSFVEYNYRHQDLCVKGVGNQPVAPYRACSSLQDLIQAVATSSARDFFICTSAFSLALGNDMRALRESLKRFARLLPQHVELIKELEQEAQDELSGAVLAGLKKRIKETWAKALHDILPRFDLVVVDEAHNLKKSRESSDRNRLLGMLLGTDKETKGSDSETSDSRVYQSSRVGRLLLLSATPFDRQLSHLRNQLDLFGFNRKELLPDGNGCTSDEVRAALAKLIVRRLNTLELNGKKHTRNMYRTEHRTGDQAEVKMNVEQQLFAALLQKKVSEYLQENCAGKFELGMLASFESYLPGDKGKPVEFDGQEERSSSFRDAQDRHVVESLIDEFNQEFKKLPPHPKMDWVADQVHQQSFDCARKQLVFVRRVNSVSELKFKLECAYDEWIGKQVASDKAVAYWFDRYHAQIRDRKLDQQDVVDADGEVKATKENFFTWFYRGENDELAQDGKLKPLPFNFRNALGQQSYLFEPNWAVLEGMPEIAACDVDWDCIGGERSSKPAVQQRFRLAQYAYLKTVAKKAGIAAGRVAERILAFAFKDLNPASDQENPWVLEDELEREPLWDLLRASSSEKLVEISPAWGRDTFNALAAESDLAAERTLRRLLTHHELLAVLCRIDHPFIDLYSLRDERIKSEGAGDADGRLGAAFVDLLQRQSVQPEFNSFHVLHEAACNLDLLIKLNFPDAYHTSAAELTRYLTRCLNPLSPVSGATGANSSNRTPLARKFRMPGYPRVLISTDVFQEGEDLHTFCDSIQHYGLSASPIALEQKVGRVDRIGSMAHRRMLGAGEGYGSHLIQVGYPHIRQSMEFYQVRQAAANLNAFQRSLHSLGEGDQKTYAQEVDLKRQQASVHGVEPQISELLESLFKIQDEDKQGDDLIPWLERQRKETDARLTHVRNLVSDAIDFKPRETTNGSVWSHEDPCQPCIEMRSAKGQAELLIAATAPCASEWPDEGASTHQRLNWLKELQSDPLVRFQSAGADDLALVRNAEVYAGGEQVLIQDEVLDVYQRVLGSKIEKTGAFEVNRVRVEALVKGLCRIDGDIEIAKQNNGELSYWFKQEGRRQPVRWTLHQGHIVMSSVVLDQARTVSLDDEVKPFLNSPLVKHTLERNRCFDLVDFHIDHQGRLAVRACHPVAHLDQEELAFIARSVAAEADRLEQVLLGLRGSE